MMKMRSLTAAAALMLLFVAQQQLAAQQTESYPAFGTMPFNQFPSPPTQAFPNSPATSPSPANTSEMVQNISYGRNDVNFESANFETANFESIVGDEGKLIEFCDDCCPKRCFYTFAEMQVLRARNAEVTYAVGANSIILPSPLQVSRIGLVDPDEKIGYKVGFGFHLGDGSRIVASYTQFNSSQADSITRGPANVLQAMTLHPQSANAGVNFAIANASLDIDFYFVDVEYHGPWSCCESYYIDWMAGFRYGRLNQEFNVQYLNGLTESVATNISFEGAGFSLGLNGEKYLCGGFTFYGETSATFLAGVVDASYSQTGSNVPVSAITSWSAGRIVTILEIELGLAWTSRCEKWKFKTGYMMNGWFNAVRTNEWIKAVQTNDFTTLGKGMSFDGLISSVEYRW